MRSLPIFFAWVSTWRYRLRRAATPTVKRSATRSLPSSLVTTGHMMPAGRPTPRAQPSGGFQPQSERVRADEIREGALAVDLHHRQGVPVLRLERLVAVDLDRLELVSADLADDGEGALAEPAPGARVDDDPRRARDRDHA